VSEFDTREVRVETTGETVSEAKWAALRELEKEVPGLDRSTVRFEVLAEGERGVLGVGYEPARVAAAVTAGPPPERPVRDESDLAASVRELLERIVSGIGVAGEIEIEERDDEVVATVSGRDLGVLIGKHGQTIDAIQYLANAILARGGDPGRKGIVVDAAGYRDRRRAVLDDLAVRSAERAISSGVRVELEPMTAVERKVVHVRLEEYPGVTTASEGAEPNRYVVIVPE
jgi:spoIIIJ-associated protein